MIVYQKLVSVNVILHPSIVQYVDVRSFGGCIQTAIRERLSTVDAQTVYDI